MLAIRMQRTGRTGHAQFRVIVQDSRFSPTRGRVVAYAGSYDPHTKVSSLDTEVISSYLEKGAQPSDRVARLLKKEGVKLPHWVVFPEPKKSAIKNPDKLRRNRPPTEQNTESSAGQALEAKVEAPATDVVVETSEPSQAQSEPAEAATDSEESVSEDAVEAMASADEPTKAEEATEEAPVELEAVTDPVAEVAADQSVEKTPQA